MSFTCLVEIVLVLDGAILECNVLENVKLKNIHSFEIKSKFTRLWEAISLPRHMKIWVTGEMHTKMT